MTILLLTVVAVSIGCSFFCSMAEAALFTVPAAHVHHTLQKFPDRRSVKALAYLKDNMSKPISAILILNTIANTSGPALSGALAEGLFGKTGLIVFAVVMTICVLVIGEVLPKFLGVSYAKSIAPAVSLPLYGLIRICSPLIAAFEWLTNKIEPDSDSPTVSHHEVLSLTAMGAEEGTIDKLEGSIIRNVIALDQLLVRNVLTPRLSVFKVPTDKTIGDTEQEILGWNYTRIPVHVPNEPDNLIGYVRQRDIFRALLAKRHNETLGSIARPLETVPELMRADKLLLRMFEHGEHICSVVDEHGALAGIITLEDLLEEVVGREISDEYDIARSKLEIS